ncbi:hypothetical protein [Treponema sp.]|uniref:hypothetical protein n=1 Tax=Treponema sp. TaxID=166 RepID=UPI00257D54D0|nr:hypothetical protein [Treponema sp.]MBE6354198.1 hypothetical protein [Treponema sp.]
MNKKIQFFFPSPEFYVIYNGSRNYPPQKILRLSDSFIDKKITEHLTSCKKITYGNREQILIKETKK